MCRLFNSAESSSEINKEVHLLLLLFHGLQAGEPRYSLTTAQHFQNGLHNSKKRKSICCGQCLRPGPTNKLTCGKPRKVKDEMFEFHSCQCNRDFHTACLIISIPEKLCFHTVHVRVADIESLTAHLDALTNIY